MGDLINFPNWIFEKERELEEKAYNLSVEKHHFENEKYQIKMEKSTLRSKILASFALGFLFGIMIPAVAILVT